MPFFFPCLQGNVGLACLSVFALAESGQVHLPECFRQGRDVFEDLLMSWVFLWLGLALMCFSRAGINLLELRSGRIFDPAELIVQGVICSVMGCVWLKVAWHIFRAYRKAGQAD